MMVQLHDIIGDFTNSMNTLIKQLYNVALTTTIGIFVLSKPLVVTRSLVAYTTTSHLYQKKKDTFGPRSKNPLLCTNLNLSY